MSNNDDFMRFETGRVTIDPIMIRSNLFQNEPKIPCANNDIDMEQDGESLEDLLNEYEGEEMQPSTLDESDGDYEIEEFDPEYSVFGSEQVAEKTESVLGKRGRCEDTLSSQFATIELTKYE